MSFDINTFRSNLNQYGVARKSHFDVLISPGGINRTQRDALPFTNLNVDADFQRVLSMRCETANFPGRSILTTENRIYGPTRKYAYGTNHGELSMSFLCSKNFRERVFFEQWQENIVGLDKLNDTYNTYSMGYYDDYTANLGIRQYNEAGGKEYSVLFRRAYPVNIGPMELDRGSEDLQRFSVDFTFEYWTRSSDWFDEAMQVATPFSLGIFGGVIGAVGGVLGSRLPVSAQRGIGAATGIPNIINNIL